MEMDSVEFCAAVSTGDNKQVGSKNGREWNKRLRLRRTAVQPLTMQGQDKHGPKEKAEEPVLNTNCSSLRKPRNKVQHNQHDINDSTDNLRFRCSQCKDNLEFLPKDLTRHFQEIHRGMLPVFPCHTCNFSTHELSYLQVHLLSHKDTFSTCDICNDNVQRTLSEFSIHLTMRHSQNGQFSCEMCENFTTGDVGVFIEHMYLHNLSLQKGSELDISDHSKDFKEQLVAKPTTGMFGCQYCGYEAPQKQQITKHVNTVHGAQNGFQTMNNIESIRETPNDVLPKKACRFTQNTVKEMPWLPHDCLSLPGKEFLDKYCSLSDAERTLEETQQFLVKSTSGESGDEKWTKALQNVLSNVPQDMNLLPEFENDIMSSSSKDLAVLTVKNRITVPQHSANLAKRLKVMPPPDKVETVVPESAAFEAHNAADSNQPQSTSNEPCYPECNITLHNDASFPSSNESAMYSQLQDNGENQQLGFEKTQYTENTKIYDTSVNANPTEGLSKKLRNERNEQTSVYKSLPKNKNRKGRRKRKTKPKAFVKGLPAFGLKLVLKKDPVKNKQWMSQSPLTRFGSGLLEDHHRLKQPQTNLKDTRRFLQRALSAESDQNKCIKTDEQDTLEDLKSTSQSVDAIWPTICSETRPLKLNLIAPDRTTKPVGFTEVEEATLPAFIRQSPNSGSNVETVQAAKDDRSSSDGTASQFYQLTLSTSSKHTLQKTDDCFRVSRENGNSVACNGSDRVERCSIEDTMTHRKTGANSSHSLKLLQTPKDKMPCDNPDLTVSSEKCDLYAEGMDEMEVSTDCFVELPSIASTSSYQNIQEELSRSTGQHLQPVPRHMERTLKLVAFSPTQLIRRPFDEQPVVVLNHPDVDIPEVTNIMRVIHRYKGEVQKVLLSHQTLKSLMAMDSEIHGENELRSAPTSSPGRMCVKNLVQERFLLKLKLKRTSRKKYQVVHTVCNTSDSMVRFCCWFCGRAFFNQDTWEAHQQRHLMESKGSNCEES